MRAKEFLAEIERLTSYDYEGGRESLTGFKITSDQQHPLPGGSGYTYQVESLGDHIKISIIDPNGKRARPQYYHYDDDEKFYDDMADWHANPNGPQMIGRLQLYMAPTPFKAYKITIITTDEAYRGKGIGFALYGIALTILKLTLISGSSQTPAGRKNWVNLATLPGVEVSGYLRVMDQVITTTNAPKRARTHAEQMIIDRNERAEKTIDRIMNLGGAYLGQKTKNNSLYHFFSFPITTSNTEVVNAVRGSDVRLYHGEEGGQHAEVGLFAKWVG
jgi:GNAT superfamily N-acetyltransferase